jgi:hypothetical protein
MLILGRLISPCRCRGTMKFVHLSCLNSWRYASPNARSVYQCDQCGYKYNFNRTQYAAFVSSLYTRVTPLLHAILIVALFHIHIIRSRRLYIWLHLQIHPLRHRRISSLHKNILPLRPPLRHRPHRRNVLVRPRLMGIPSPSNSPRSLLLWSRRRRSLGIGCHWSCSMGIHFGDGWVGGFWYSFTDRQLAEKGGRGTETTGDHGGDNVGYYHFDWYC